MFLVIILNNDGAELLTETKRKIVDEIIARRERDNRLISVTVYEHGKVLFHGVGRGLQTVKDTRLERTLKKYGEEL